MLQGYKKMNKNGCKKFGELLGMLCRDYMSCMESLFMVYGFFQSLCMVPEVRLYLIGVESVEELKGMVAGVDQAVLYSVCFYVLYCFVVCVLVIRVLFIWLRMEKLGGCFLLVFRNIVVTGLILVLMGWEER